VSSKKLQVFVSSTYADLKEERQAVVQAILTAGHIPAGMELFAAGSKSQLETIRRWIKQSDVFMLILGGRYGSIDPESGKSYIQLEYEYALELDKPMFAAVISENYEHRKIKDMGKPATECDRPDLYKALRKTVLDRMCKFFEDEKDLKLIVHESIPEVTRDLDLAGWIRGDEVDEPKKTLETVKELRRLQVENARLKEELAELPKFVVAINGFAFMDNWSQVPQAESLVVVMAHVVNTGSPSIATGWTLLVEVGGMPNGLRGLPITIPEQMTLGSDDMHTVTFTSSDALYEKTVHQPIPKGGLIGGVLLFAFQVQKSILESVGNRLTLTCWDAYNREFSGPGLVTADQRGSPMHYPGMKEQRPPLSPPAKPSS